MKTVSTKVKAGFTLIELLVVISIIAVLMSIMFPALNKARNTAYAVKCGANLKNVGTAVAVYTADFERYPPSYVYPDSPNGNWSMNTQNPAHPNGYLHWSYHLLDMGNVDVSAFQCGSFSRGGLPRTNPGPDSKDWEQGQRDQNGQTMPNSFADLQSPRIAYAANGAIMPRNKFTPPMSRIRANRLVRATEVHSPGSTILATEFINDFEANVSEGVYKSHRPIYPFTNIGAGNNSQTIYSVPRNISGFQCNTADVFSDEVFKAMRPSQLRGLINGETGAAINSVGRHHNNNTTNFLYADSHVERKRLIDTVQEREWGRKFYGLTGLNDVDYRDNRK